MKSKKKLTIFLLITLLIIICTVGIFLYILRKNQKKNDALNFKIAYESLNNTIRESDGKLYNNVTIPEDNPIKNISVENAIKILNNGTGVIYFGTNWCPWCRTAIAPLFDAAKQSKINIIFYLNLDTINTGFEIKNDNLIRDNEKISPGYLELLKRLDLILENKSYIINTNDGKVYDTKEKYIPLPMVITVKNGYITSFHSKTVPLEEKQTKYDSLTNKQTIELTNIYLKMFNSLK